MRLVTTLLLAFLLVVPAAASAQEGELTPITDRDEAVALMALYAGLNWTARGKSRSDFDDPLEDASCRLDATFDAETATLTNTGRCATTARAINIGGNLTITEDGELTGGYFGRFEAAQLLSSAGYFHEAGFIVEARYLAQIRRQQREIEVRISVSRPQPRDDGRIAFAMIVEVRNPDTGEYVEFSALEFVGPPAG